MWKLIISQDTIGDAVIRRVMMGIRLTLLRIAQKNSNLSIIPQPLTPNKAMQSSIFSKSTFMIDIFVTLLYD
jgi:hypothetical protein